MGSLRGAHLAKERDCLASSAQRMAQDVLRLQPSWPVQTIQDRSQPARLSGSVSGRAGRDKAGDPAPHNNIVAVRFHLAYRIRAEHPIRAVEIVIEVSCSTCLPW